MNRVPFGIVFILSFPLTALAANPSAPGSVKSHVAALRAKLTKGGFSHGAVEALDRAVKLGEHGGELGTGQVVRDDRGPTRPLVSEHFSDARGGGGSVLAYGDEGRRVTAVDGRTHSEDGTHQRHEQVWLEGNKLTVTTSEGRPTADGVRVETHTRTERPRLWGLIREEHKQSTVQHYTPGNLTPNSSETLSERTTWHFGLTKGKKKAQ
jgi:hypothetical protein